MRSLLGCCVAAYQVGLVAGVWDPIFGSATTQAVLTSPLARARPVPDAMLHAAAHVGEACLALVGGRDRWLAHPCAVLAYGFVLAGLALSSLGLALLHVMVLRSVCTVWVMSAGISFVNAGPGRREICATVGGLSARHVESLPGGIRLHAEDAKS